MEIKDLNELSYEWLRVLKYTYEKRNTHFDDFDDKQSYRSLKSSLKSSISRKSATFKNIYENFRVNQMHFTMNYDFEYSDLSSQLAVTPLTERCFLNLTSTLKTLKAGTLVGPNNSGKRQTLGMLAQACGQHLQEINCDEYMTSRIATWYMKGLASSGSWVLFEKIEKLSQSK